VRAASNLGQTAKRFYALTPGSNMTCPRDSIGWLILPTVLLVTWSNSLSGVGISGGEVAASSWLAAVFICHRLRGSNDDLATTLYAPDLFRGSSTLIVLALWYFRRLGVRRQHPCSSSLLCSVLRGVWTEEARFGLCVSAHPRLGEG